jgi:type I restriction enzyme S subunit
MNISRNGEIVLDEVKSVEDDTDRRIVSGDILFNNTNSPALVGKTALFSMETPMAYSNHMTRLRVVDEVDARFMVRYFNKLWSDGYFEAICSNHVNQASISRKRLQTVPFPLIPISEQHCIVEILEEQFSRLDAAAASIQEVMGASNGFEGRMADLRRSILHAAFSGSLTAEWRACNG